MCGLYSFRTSPEETRALFDYPDRPEFPPRPHVAPGRPIAIVRMEQRQRHFALVRWGFIPAWVKEVKRGPPLINARGETLMEKPSFRHPMTRRRCLVPADGFFEWLGDVPGRKIPYFIERADHQLFAFGALWEHWMGADGSEIETAILITTKPNREIAKIRDRMPVVIAPEDHETWLTGDVKDALKLIRPAPDGSFVLQPTVIGRGSPPAKPPDQLSLL